ncbi:MAG: calcium-binding protein [Solirubrobacterales bacterium]
MSALVSAGLVLALLVSSANVDDPRTCLGREATITGPNTGLDAPGFAGVIVGTSDGDVIVGSGRAEWIVAAGGRDVICGEGGADHIVVGNWSCRGDRHAELDGGPGADVIDSGFAPDRIIGGPGDDRIDGEFGGDRIAGNGGADFIRAQAGPDRVRLGAGSDHVEASSGDDVVHGGAGQDKISTGVGKDLAFGGSGSDFIHMIWQDDRGYGGPGDDALHGGTGRDRCFGGQGSDIATGCEDQRSVEDNPLLVAAEADSSQPDPGIDPNTPRLGSPAFERAGPVLAIEAFLHRLRQMDTIRAPAATPRQIRRKHLLGYRVARLIERRYERHLPQAGRVEAVFEQSVERWRLKLILAAICDQIDRLRWTR